MTAIDQSKPVLVTGANGYVASWLVKRLLEDGITVHAAVRNPSNDKKIAHLKAAAEKASGSIRFFAADLMKPGSYKEAMEAFKFATLCRRFSLVSSSITALILLRRVSTLVRVWTNPL